MSRNVKKRRNVMLIELDHLCLGAMTKTIRCDADMLHSGYCSHTHTDELLCAWMESFGEETEKQHKALGNGGLHQFPEEGVGAAVYSV